MPEFIDDEIEVRFAQQPGPPCSFLWRGREYHITAIYETRRKLDFRKAWWGRRHRDYYVVQTDTGELFELYFHRGPGKRHWILYRRLAGLDNQYINTSEEHK